VTIPNRQLHIGLFVGAQFLYAVTHYIYSPTLPLYVQSKTEDLALVGLALSMYGLFQLVIRLPLGIVTDRVGWCKPFIVGGFALAAVGAWLMARAEGITGLMIGRALCGVAAGIFGPILVVFSGLFLPHESVQSSTILTAVGAVGIMSSTAITGILNELGGYGLAFYVSVGAALLALVLVLPAYERRRPPQPSRPRAIVALITRRDVLVPSLLCAVLQYASTATTYGFLPILAGQMGVRDVMQGFLMSTQVGFLTLGSVLAGFAARRLGDWRVVWLGLALLAVGVVIAALAPVLWLLFLAQCLIGFAWGAAYPVVAGISIRHVADVGRNTAMGAFQMGCSLGVFTGSWVSGLVADLLGIRPMFGVTAFAILVMAAVVALRNPDRVRV
jgi:MFS family permease